MTQYQCIWIIDLYDRVLPLQMVVDLVNGFVMGQFLDKKNNTNQMSAIFVSVAGSHAARIS